MELIISHFVDPVPAMVISEGQDCPIRPPEVPNTHSSISSTGSHRMQSALVVGKVEYLVYVGCEGKITLLIISLLLSQIEHPHLLLDTKCD